MSCIIHGSNARLLKLAFKGFSPTWPHRNSAAATSAQTAFTYERAKIGAGERNRTVVISLEGCCSTIELHPQKDRNLPLRPRKAACLDRSGSLLSKVAVLFNFNQTGFIWVYFPVLDLKYGYGYALAKEKVRSR